MQFNSYSFILYFLPASIILYFLANKVSRAAAAVLVAAAAFCAFACASGSSGPVSEVLPVLSEACCANLSLMANPVTGEYDDYIELLNPAGEPLNVGGFGVSDSEKAKKTVLLPEIEIEPYGCLILWANGADEMLFHGKTEDTASCLTVPFKLSEGETVYLFSREGKLLDSVTLAGMHKNIAMTSLSGTWTEAYGTPGRDNRDAVLYYPPTLDEPVFDHADGFYEEPFELVITAGEGEAVYYTLDGRVPDTESALYTGPVRVGDRSGEPNLVVSQPNTTLDRSGAITEPVRKGTVVRAVAVGGDGAYSDAATAVYFVGESVKEDWSGAVLNVTADPRDLFGEYGICVTGPAYDRWYDGVQEGDQPYPQFYVRGPVTERDAEIVLWDGGKVVLRDSCGIRLGGHSSRQNATKRFSFYARKLYSGSNTFSGLLFSEGKEHSFGTREGRTDIIAHRLAEKLGIGGLAVYEKPVTVFVNGEYYTETYIRERYTGQYFENHYGIDKDDLVLISANELDEGTYADYEEYLAFITFIEESDASDPVVYEQIRKLMDTDEYARYVAFRLYLNDTDWDLYKNCKVWRTRNPDGAAERDGRWRFAIQDMDGCGWKLDWPSFDPFADETPATGKTFLEMPVLGSLFRSEAFRTAFVRAWVGIMEDTCAPEKVLTLAEEYSIPEEGPGAFWYRIEERREYALSILTKALGLSAEELERILSEATE